MSQGGSLHRRLAQLAAAGLGQGAGRTVRAAGREELSRTILREADTIVMPRELRVEGAAGQGLALEVASRRILRVRDLDDPSGERALLLDAAGVGDALRDKIGALAAAGSAVRLVHGRVGRDIDPAEPGISVRALAEAWNVTLETPLPGAAGEVLDTFLSGEAGALLAGVMFAGETSESFGDEKLVEALLALTEAELTAALRQAGAAESWRFAVLGPATEGGPHFALAAMGETLFLMAVAPDDIAGVADRWRRALA